MTSLKAAFDYIDQLVPMRMTQTNLPGWTIAVTDREKLLWVAAYGFADVEAGTPVTPHSLFEIGSIGKSFTCIALLQLREEGKLDLHAPVSQYLPWFQVCSNFAPITLHHLMRHTAGIIRGTEQAPHGLYDCWALQETQATTPPGERWHYSSVGYKALGFLLERLSGQSYPQVIQSRILDPLGMERTYPAVTFETRKISTVKYRNFYDDRPQHPSHGIAPALWSEYATADGCPVSNALDMAIYLRMLLNRGRGPRGPVISEESFKLLTQPEVSAGNDYYAYALALYPMDGYTLIGHGGATTGYNTCMMMDPETGLGIVSLVNKMDETDMVEATTIHALTVLRAAYYRREISAPSPAPDPTAIPNAADYAGTYRANNGTLQIAAEDGKLLLRCEGQAVALERRSDDTFCIPHPRFNLFLLEFARQDGKVVEAFHGDNWYTSDSYSGPQQFDYPREWAAYPGHYRARNPELSNFRVVVRKGALVLILPWGLVRPLTPLGDSLFRIEDDERSPETLRFTAVVEGQALRADFSGCPYYRTFTP